MGFIAPQETQISEGPQGETVETKVPGSFGDGLEAFARAKMPMMTGMSDMAGMSDLIGMNAKPKEGGGLSAILKLMAGGG